ncbi:phosphoglycolate phosphatase [Granulosicoccus antarcticus]|uniref:phosphoglycolate phosphatase n=1 Tax=Granulosicoccus antarcticus IMCC3135 TaxID=1192854 RepID=A0A2Z2NIX6_9GAMM|nr:phosphoglycolate phosphatase [Granulosicoccus antarcticus]ASJ71023.1 Phosphoglycolate phosphatase [Granulosicoccus antarcticus IMCC3135]
MRKSDSSSAGRVQGIELIAIDLDGTLVDSVKDMHEAVIAMQAGLSLDASSEQQVRGWVGNGIERLVHRALTGDMLKEAEPVLFEDALSGFKQAYAETIGRYSTLYPDVREGLLWMASQDIPLVMVTNKASFFANMLIEQLQIDQFFAHKIGGDDVAAAKPDPEALLLAASLCKASAVNSVLIGDSIHDFKAARAAGFHSVGVSYGYNHGVPVRELDPSLAPGVVVDSFKELPEVLQSLGDVWTTT